MSGDLVGDAAQPPSIPAKVSVERAKQDVRVFMPILIAREAPNRAGGGKVGGKKGAGTGAAGAIHLRPFLWASVIAMLSLMYGEHYHPALG